MLKHYAMILRDRIIAVENSEKEPVYPPDQHGNPVFAFECDPSITINDFFCPETKTFRHTESMTYVPTPAERIEEAVDAENKNSLIIMEAIADQYEQNLNNRLNDMEVQATIYEAVLALGEGGAAV